MLAKAFAAIGGRKFFVNIVVLAVGVAVDIFTEKGLSTNLMYLLFGATTGYGVVNVGKYALNLKQQSMEITAPEPVDLTPVLEAIQALKPKKGRAATVKVDTAKLEAIVAQLSAKVEAQEKVNMDHLKAIQNQGIVIADTLKQSTQLQVQTHQTIMGLIQQASGGR